MITAKDIFFYGRRENEDDQLSGSRIYVPDDYIEWIRPKSMFFEGLRGCGKTSVLKMLSWEVVWGLTNIKTKSSPRIKRILEKPRFIGVYSTVLRLDVDLWERWRATEKEKQVIFATYLEFLFIELFANAIHKLNEKRNTPFNDFKKEKAFAHDFSDIAWRRSDLSLKPIDYTFAGVSEQSQAANNLIRRMVANNAPESEILGIIDIHSPGSLIKAFFEKLVKYFNKATGWSFYPMIDDCHILTAWQAQVLNTAIARSSRPIAYKITAVHKLFKPADTIWERLIVISHDLSTIKLTLDVKDKEQLRSYRMLLNGICRARLEDSGLSDVANEFSIEKLLGNYKLERELEKRLQKSESKEVGDLLAMARKNYKRLSITRAWLEKNNIRFDPKKNDKLSQRRVYSAYYKKWSHSAAIALCKEYNIRFPYCGHEVAVQLSYGSIREFLRIMSEMAEIYEREIRELIRRGSVPSIKQTSAIINASENSFNAINERSDVYVKKGMDIITIVDRLGMIFGRFQSMPLMLKTPECASVKVRKNDFEKDDDLVTALNMGILANALVSKESRPALHREFYDVLIGIHPIYAPKYMISYRNPFYYPQRISCSELRSVFFDNSVKFGLTLNNIMRRRKLSSRRYLNYVEGEQLNLF